MDTGIASEDVRGCEGLLEASKERCGFAVWSCGWTGRHASYSCELSNGNSEVIDLQQAFGNKSWGGVRSLGAGAIMQRLRVPPPLHSVPRAPVTITGANHDDDVLVEHGAISRSDGRS